MILISIFTFKMSVSGGIDFRYLESLVMKAPLSLMREHRGGSQGATNGS